MGRRRQVTGPSSKTSTSPGRSEMERDDTVALRGHHVGFPSLKVKVMGAFSIGTASEGESLTELVTPGSSRGRGYGEDDPRVLGGGNHSEGEESRQVGASEALVRGFPGRS